MSSRFGMIDRSGQQGAQGTCIEANWQQPATEPGGYAAQRIGKIMEVPRKWICLERSPALFQLIRRERHGLFKFTGRQTGIVTRQS